MCVLTFLEGQKVLECPRVGFLNCLCRQLSSEQVYFFLVSDPLTNNTKKLSQQNGW